MNKSSNESNFKCSKTLNVPNRMRNIKRINAVIKVILNVPNHNTLNSYISKSNIT